MDAIIRACNLYLARTLRPPRRWSWRLRSCACASYFSVSAATSNSRARGSYRPSLSRIPSFRPEKSPTPCLLLTARDCFLQHGIHRKSNQHAGRKLRASNGHSPYPEAYAFCSRRTSYQRRRISPEFFFSLCGHPRRAALPALERGAGMAAMNKAPGQGFTLPRNDERGQKERTIAMLGSAAKVM